MQVTLTLTPGQIDKPAGKTAGDWRIGLTQGGSVVHNYVGPLASCVFPSVTPGEYTAFAERRAIEGGQIGPTVEAAITVPATVAGAEQVDVVAAITATFG